MQIHRHAWACALAFCCGAYAQDPKTEAGKPDPAQGAMTAFYDCAKRYSEKYSKSREPAQDIADAALSYCESSRERLRGLLIDKLSVGGRSAREQVNSLFPGIIEKARLLSIRTVVEARYEATLKARTAPSVAAQPPAPASTTGTATPPVPTPATGSVQPAASTISSEIGRPTPDSAISATQPSPAPTSGAGQPPPQRATLPAADVVIPVSSDATSIVRPATFPDGPSIIAPLPPPAGPIVVIQPAATAAPPASAGGVRPKPGSSAAAPEPPIIVRPPPAPDL